VTYTDLYIGGTRVDGGDAPFADVCDGGPGPGRRRLCPFTTDVNVFRNGTAQCAYVKAGTCGSGSERRFISARRGIQRLLSDGGCEPVPGTSCALRSDAQLVVIFFTDTGDQTSNTDTDGGTGNTVDAWVNFFQHYNGAQPDAGAIVDGIVCPLRPDG